MREILFRGKRIDNGEWVEGFFVRKLDSLIGTPNYFIVGQGTTDGMLDPLCTWYIVEANTIGQYTGLKDKNGKRIFEGDVVRCEEGRVCEVVYFTSPGIASFDMKPIAGFDKPYPKLWTLFSGSEVIGNIHDNPELLKEG